MVSPWFLLWILALPSLSLAKREEEDATMLQRLTASKALSLAAREACGPPVKWPCDNDMVAKFPLQVINSDHKNCTAGRAAFDRLDLSTGQYTPLCYVPEHCFNACGISPDNEIFCREKLGGKTGNNLVRVDCPLNMTEVELGLPITPVEGSLCFFGKIPGTYAANFDVNGSYWFKRDRGNEGEIFEITNSSIFDLIDDGTTEAQNTKISSITSIVQRANLDRLADLNVLKLDLGQANGPGEQAYVVGCWGHHVYLQQVSGNLTNAEPIELTMIGVDVKGRNSGAQWLFNGSVYCAYNDGKTGVIEVVLSETTFDGPTNGTVRAGRVNSSAKTSSNDGLNCLNAATPFPPCPPLATTTSAAPSTSTLLLDAPEECGPPVKWPCGNKKISSFPLQLINSDSKNCSAGRAAIDRLDLNTGEYTPLCYVPGHCFNGCGISPETNEIFCREKLSGKTGNNLVRIDCPLNMTEVELGLPITPVEGSLCFFGKIPATYAANFDVNGSFWFKRNRGNEGEIFEITNSSLVDLIDDGTTEAQNTQISSITSIVQRANLNRLADLNVLKLDLGQANGPGEQAYLVGCWGKHVYLQQVSGNLTNAEPIELTMIGVDMAGRNSGAQWLFNGSVYCAYNDGKTGVIEVVLSETTLDGPTNGTVRAGRVNSSAKTNSNDGLNCLNAATPFPECPPLPTTEATTTTMEGFDPNPSTSNVGSGDGDPHIHTFDGQHYLLLTQGSFMFWHFSGVEAETLTDQNFLKKVPVDFQIYTHYSGHYSYTKGLLLLDSSGHHQRSLELTSESCRWLTKTTPEQSWRELEGPEVLASPDIDGDEMTAFDFKRSRGQKMHVELLMKTQQGFKTVGKLFASCKPGQHLNVKIKMFSEKEVHLVKGQLGASHSDPEVQLHNGSVASFFKESGQELRMDQDFETKTDWEQLGGSPDASTYLQEVDDQGPAVLKSCTKQEEDEARETCQKYLGTDAKISGSSTDFEAQRANFQETLADCIFDVCVGGGETAAELAAEILNAF